MAYAFKRAARATAITSSTTAVAFLANAFNPIMPMVAFGIYASIVICVNYTLIIIVYPPVIVFYEYDCRDKWCICCRKNVEEK